jgi:hypothetical protein
MIKESLLIWDPERSEQPRVRATVERLKLNDLGLSGEGLGVYAEFGSLIDFFAGDDEGLRRQFQQDFMKYLTDDDHPCRLHPLSKAIEGEFIDFPSYRTPTEWAHDEFKAWIKKHRGMEDFLEPAGRKWNDYRGNLGLHLVESSENLDVETLKRNNGVAGYFEQDHFRFYCDNRYNPYRWVAPINEVQHHEQPSLCCTIPVKKDIYQQAGAVLKSEDQTRYVLEYEMDVELEDLRPLMKEETVFDFYGKKELDGADGVVGQSHWNAQRLAGGETLKGKGFSYGQKRFVQNWIDHRYVNPNLQVSLMVNFREREGRYRLAEFMIAEYNQEPIFFHDKDVDPKVDSGREFNPFRVDGNGVIPTANEELSEHVVDGGCSGNFAWTRVASDVYKSKTLAPDADIILEGGECWHWDGTGKQKRTLSGSIDITAFYKQALKLNYFPGQRGYWGDRWVGFCGDDPAFKDPSEQHGLEWLGLIFENHGPFKIDILSKRFNLTQVSS